MNEKVKAKIEAINASMAGPYPCDNGVSYAAPQCGACMTSRAVAVYCSHVKPLEEALAKAEAMNAATIAEHVVNFMAQLGGAVSGDGGMVRMKMECVCPYCNNISYSVEEATPTMPRVKSIRQ